MERQLTLIESNPRWRLDERTCEIGRRGIAAARAALASTAQPSADVQVAQKRSAA
ncbi:MAG: hypothetical protein QOK15_1855 [Nocardioidaceae bacterium]|nr:hypothetical protein [Nocardioidaceae bacterium]